MYDNSVKGDSANKLSCQSYLMDCLRGKGVSECKAYLLSETFWPDATEEVKQMQPVMVLQTLNAFEFGFYSEYDSRTKQEIKKVHSVSQWLEKLKGMVPDKLTQPDFDNIAKNKRLLAYLELVVAKTNNNPAILNENVKVPSNVYDPEAFKGTRLYRLGLRLRPSSENPVTVVNRLSSAIDQENLKFRSLFGLPGFAGAVRPVYMFGGSDSMINQMEERLSGKVKLTGDILLRHYNALTARLRTHRKSISSADDNKIKSLISSLKNTEEKLVKTMLYAEKYSKLLEVYGEQDSSSVLSVQHLQNFVDRRNKYFERVSKRQSDLITIIRHIADIVNKETPEDKLVQNAANVDFSRLMN